MASHLLGDLNDFIQPSQVCVKPVPSKEETIKAGEVRLDGDGGDPLNTSPVTISLNDCLACSGCITSAETVLVNQQTYKQVYQVLDVNMEAAKAALPKPQLVVMSISPQSLTALAARFNLSLEAVARRLYRFLKETLGVDFVFDTVLARDVCLFACALEFLERYETKDRSQLPVITGACPGWICYVEKTQESLVPLLSRIKSPQQIMGTLVKHFFPSRCLASRSLSPSHLFHAAVMPCYDKKLEASRPDFFDEPSQAKEVDCVITTGELLSMIEERIGFEQFLASDAEGPSPFDPQLSLLSADGSSLLSHAGSGSGGYMEHVLSFAVKRLYSLDLVRDSDGGLVVAGAETSPFELVVQTHRNADYRDFILQRKADLVPLFRFAQVYGFRNVQTLVRKLRTGRVTYDYVEVMACPGGCLNGGGQKLPSSDGASALRTPAQNLAEMNRLYRQMPVVQPLTVAKVEQIVREWLGGPTSPLLRTGFRAVPKTDSAQGSISVQW